MLPTLRARPNGNRPDEPVRQLQGPLGPPPSPFESRAMGAVRAFWNLVLSLIIGTMIGYFVHAFASDALATLLGPSSGMWRFGLGLAAWLLGGSVAFVMFVSYYLDDSRR